MSRLSERTGRYERAGQCVENPDRQLADDLGWRRGKTAESVGSVSSRDCNQHSLLATAARLREAWRRAVGARVGAGGAFRI